jgi:GNAT superfamily N-acetyltransferase
MGTELTIRAADPADSDDVGFLWLMLAETGSWRAGEPSPGVDELANDPAAARYLAGWGRAGDSGVIALACGRRAGAAWYRHFERDDRGYGFIAPDIPELGVAVVEELRGRGIGRALMEALIERARLAGEPALSLSVEFENPAARLYQRLGFARVGVVGEAWTMRLDLAPP